MRSPTGSDVNGNGTGGDDLVSQANDQRLIDQLVELWQGHRRRDLETRHRTGVLLNERLGPPTEGQPYGLRVLERVGGELRIAQSDLSRMRWFAHLFVGPDRLRQEYPEVNSWARVKELLPGLKPREGGEAGARTATLLRPATGGVTRSLTGLIKKLRGMDSIPEGGRGDAVRGKLRELIEVATDCLGNPTPSRASETDSSPGDPARANVGDCRSS
jgi:hypothetical protein